MTPALKQRLGRLRDIALKAALAALLLALATVAAQPLPERQPPGLAWMADGIDGALLAQAEAPPAEQTAARAQPAGRPRH